MAAVRYQRIYCKRNEPFPGLAAGQPSFDADDGFLIDRISETDVRITGPTGTIEIPWAGCTAWPLAPKPALAIPPPPPEPEPVVEIAAAKRKRVK